MFWLEEGGFSRKGAVKRHQINLKGHQFIVLIRLYIHYKCCYKEELFKSVLGLDVTGRPLLLQIGSTSSSDAQNNKRCSFCQHKERLCALLTSAGVGLQETESQPSNARDK